MCDPLIDLIDGSQYQVVSKRFIIGNYWQTIEHYYIALPLQHPFDIPELIDINFSKYLPLDIDIPTAITSRKRVKEGGLRTKGITKSSANQQLLISVITVVFNGEEKIEQRYH